MCAEWCAGPPSAQQQRNGLAVLADLEQHARGFSDGVWRRTRGSDRLQPCVSPTAAAPVATTDGFVRRVSHVWQVEAHEAATGRQYEYIAKLRPDEEFCLPLPPAHSFPPHLVSTLPYPSFADKGQLHDHLAIMGRKIAPVYFSARDELLHTPCESVTAFRERYDPMCHIQGLPMHRMAPECLVASWLRRNEIVFSQSTLLSVGSCVCLWKDSGKQQRETTCIGGKAGVSQREQVLWRASRVGQGGCAPEVAAMPVTGGLLKRWEYPRSMCR